MPGNPLLKSIEHWANNTESPNGTDNGTWCSCSCHTAPEENVLGDSLHEYARMGYSLVVRRQKLYNDHGLKIGKTLLTNLNTYFNVPSVRKPIPREIADQKILNEMATDTNGYRGPSTVKRNLALAGCSIPQKKIKRTQLTAHSTFQEVHCDGHEKLGALTLQMGGVALPIYGVKDKWGDAVLYLKVIPNDRDSDVIGHVFLDFFELYGGSELGHMYAFVTGLKTAYAPGIDLMCYPAMVALYCTNNTPIEGLWRWFQDQCGKNLYIEITKGRDEGIFNPNNPIHVYLFNWIWPPIVQGELDHFTEWWNSHVIRRQHNKTMPSGVSPNKLHTHPEYYGGRCFAIPVPRDAINEFRKTIKISGEAALAWVPEDFDVIAGQVYEMLGSPSVSAETAWDFFSQMTSVMC
ncbi:hypothetical protein B0H14DRAFT_3095915 [Mycena olivaceomarginata]|nr:hypothetical protein B0H14DRAFT_3095915 [Mycena olivaceomarginata]